LDPTNKFTSSISFRLTLPFYIPTETLISAALSVSSVEFNRPSEFVSEQPVGSPSILMVEVVTSGSHSASALLSRSKAMAISDTMNVSMLLYRSSLSESKLAGTRHGVAPSFSFDFTYRVMENLPSLVLSISEWRIVSRVESSAIRASERFHRSHVESKTQWFLVNTDLLAMSAVTSSGSFTPEDISAARQSRTAVPPITSGRPTTLEQTDWTDGEWQQRETQFPVLVVAIGVAAFLIITIIVVILLMRGC
jgi:hypothetical protein